MDAIMQLDRVVRVGGLPVPAGCHQQKPLHVVNGRFHNELDQTTLIKNLSLSSKLSEGQLQTGVQPASKLGILTADTSTDFILRRKSRGERPQFGHSRKCCCLKPLEGGLHNMSTMMTKRRCDCYDLYDKCVPYMDAWTWQRAMVEKNIAIIQEGSDVNDAIIILQHSPVYTMGTRSSEEFLLFDKEQPPCDFYRTERGGEVTYHGPGQLVMYPILNLRHYQTDLHWYLRSLEEVVIRALRNACAIEATRIKGITGVWVGNEKVAAIGVRVSRWVTYHGLALNVTTDLSPFKRIVPCGISTRPVGSVHEILHRQSRPQTGEDLSSMSTEELLDLLHKNLLHEFSEVFGLELSYAKKDLSILSANSYN